MTPPFAVALGLLLATADPPPKGAYERTSPDLSMALSRRAPLRFQPLVLLALDTGAPLLVAAGAMASGALLGTVAGVASMQLAPPPERSALVPRVAAAGSLGALLSGALALVLMDATLSTFHLGHLWRSRLFLLLPLVPGALLAGGLLLLEPSLRGPGAGAAAAAAGVVLMGAPVMLGASLAGALMARERTDNRQGSALWEEAR
jgi:hypothetical protein